MTPAQAKKIIAEGVRDDLQPFIVRHDGKAYKWGDLIRLADPAGAKRRWAAAKASKRRS